MQKVIIYHNPRCSKSRQALQFLLDNDIQPEVIEYLKNPLSKDEVANLVRLLAIEPQELMRKNEDVYKKLNLFNLTLTLQQNISVLAENPILLERPIVIINNKAIIARPAEKIRELL